MGKEEEKLKVHLVFFKSQKDGRLEELTRKFENLSTLTYFKPGKDSANLELIKETLAPESNKTL